jgi:hypothetical protein
MPPLFPGMAAGALRTLSDAFRTGRLTAAAGTLSIGRIVPGPADATADILRLLGEGMSPSHLSLLLDSRADLAEAGLASGRHAELVWTGPEGHQAFSRDTSVVVRELFETAQLSVLVSTFVVRQGVKVFEPLARRMDERPDLDVEVFLHVGRGPRDSRYESEILREFAAEFKGDWPGTRLPKVYYDPRGLAAEPANRATWHAKCVVVDESVAFVASANFTEWAHQKNVEAGVLLRDPPLAMQIRGQFDGLVRSQQVRRVPGL